MGEEGQAKYVVHTLTNLHVLHWWDDMAGPCLQQFFSFSAPPTPKTKNPNRMFITHVQCTLTNKGAYPPCETFEKDQRQSSTDL